jgi:alpha-ketoglutarate-dependent taurine dioxygenase
VTPDSIPAPREDFPLVARARANALDAPIEDFAAAARQLLEQRLSDVGAILLRGIPLASATAFSEFRRALGYESMPYTGDSATRTEVAPSVMTPTLMHPARAIMLHNDMSYAAVVPRHIFFYCQSSLGPGEGGETPIARSADWDAELGEGLIAQLIGRGLTRSVDHPDRSTASAPRKAWQVRFGSEDREEVERLCRERGNECHWNADGSLTLRNDVPAAIEVAGKRVWFCTPQSTRPASNVDVRYRSGEELEPEILEHVRAAQWRIAVAFEWQTADVLCLDNLLCQHGRLPYRNGAERKLFVSLGTPCRVTPWPNDRPAHA